ncbi:MAG: MBL fold metallo-hydrolase [Candidatus Magasanikbacteria bacterium]
MRRIVSILLVCLALVLGLFFYTRCFSFTGFRIIFFNVGQGDSALIQFDNGQKMLVDCGPDRKVLSKLGKYLPFYDRTIDYLLVTHFDNDHYGGCADVIKRYRIGTIIENGVKKEGDSYWMVWNEKNKEKGIKNKVINGNEVVSIASTTLEFFSPDSGLRMSEKDKDSNNLSIVFKLVHASTTALFMGDAEIPLEQAIIQKYCNNSTSCPAIRVNYLKIGHHGSDSSSGDDFLAAVSPKMAVISVGKNTFGHPSLRILKHLERLEIEAWKTDEKGDIIIK